MYRKILLKKSFLALKDLCKNKNIYKSDKGNSIVIVNKTDYLDKTENLLNDTRKSEKINLKNDVIYPFVPNVAK